ncbi:MAG: aminotransferase class I/II-fold pyridoxal phosphate-dependent enzyme [Mucilaginibacter sp.]|uniref:pyridoxal phosphate-dependent decarboxylase family protein n=1 Tax=Mucilaginibacter sp. TaxID=1882438 RepID=UPI0031AD97E3
MKSIINQAYDPQHFNQAGLQVIESLTSAFKKAQTLPIPHTIQFELPEDQLAFWQNDLDNREDTNLLNLLENVMAKSINLHSRGYLGHQVPPTLPVTILTSAIIAYLNNGMAVYEMGMAGNAMEKLVIAWLAKHFGFGEEASGLVTSGGSLGNLTALVAARNYYCFQHPQVKADELAIMVSEEAHYSISRAFTVMGIPLENVIKIPVTDQFNIDITQLETLYANAQSKHVFCIIGCACSTATGAYDNLAAIADFANKHQIWFHVDGAHGAPAIFSPSYAHLLNGIERANSIIVDFHKMMMVPSLSTALIFRDKKLSRYTFTQNAQYLWDDSQSDEWYNSGKQTFECTKPMTILHTYAIMKIYGDRIYQENIEHLYGQAKIFAGLLKDTGKFELACEPQANIVCYRFTEGKGDLDELNRQILKRTLDKGNFYIVSTTIGGQVYLRSSIMNPMVTQSDLKELIGSIITITQEMDK